MDAAHHVPQFGERLLRLRLRLVEQGTTGRGIGVVGAFGEPDAHRQGDQAGLGAVVQIAFDAPQLGAVRGDRAGPGLGELLDPAGQAGLRRRRQEGPGPRACEIGDTGEQGQDDRGTAEHPAPQSVDHDGGHPDDQRDAEQDDPVHHLGPDPAQIAQGAGVLGRAPQPLDDRPGQGGVRLGHLDAGPGAHPPPLEAREPPHGQHGLGQHPRTHHEGGRRQRDEEEGDQEETGTAQPEADDELPGRPPSPAHRPFHGDQPIRPARPREVEPATPCTDEWAPCRGTRGGDQHGGITTHRVTHSSPGSSP